MTDKNTIHNLLDKGLTYFGLGQVDQAIEIWNQVLELEPDNQKARKYLEFVQNNWEPPKDLEEKLVQSNKLDIPQESIDQPTEQQTETKIGSSSLPSYPLIDEPQHLESEPLHSVFDNNPALENLKNQPAQSETAKDHIDETDNPLEEEANNHAVEIDIELDDQEVDYQQTSEAILGLVADTLNNVQPIASDLNLDEPKKDPENDAHAWLKSAKDHLEMDDFTNALDLSEKVLLKEENHFEALSIKREAEGSLLSLLSSKLGDLERIPVVGMMDEEIIWLNLDHQAGFVLSLVDSQMTLDEIISVSNLKQLDIMRILVQLLQENIIKLT